MVYFKQGGQVITSTPEEMKSSFVYGRDYIGIPEIQTGLDFILTYTKRYKKLEFDEIGKLRVIKDLWECYNKTVKLSVLKSFVDKLSDMGFIIFTWELENRPHTRFKSELEWFKAEDFINCCQKNINYNEWITSKKYEVL